MAARKGKGTTETKHTLGMTRVKSRRGTLTELELTNLDPHSFQNQRTGDFQDSSSPADGSGNSFTELSQSIDDTGDWDENNVHTGMKEPITARLKKGAGKKGPQYEIVKGYRRYAVISMLAQRDDIQGAKIQVIVKELTDLEALEENIFENTARDNLSTPDLAWAAYNLKQKHLAFGEDMSDNRIAQRMGKNQSHISRLIRMITAAPVICGKWRDMKGPLNLDMIEKLSQLPADEQSDAYDNALAVKAGKGAKGPRGAALLDIAAKKAKRLAGEIGTLVRANLIASSIDWTSPEDLSVLVSLEGLSAAELKQVGTEAHAAFALALTPPPPKKGKAEAAQAAAVEN